MKPQKQKKNYRFQPCRDIFTCKVCGWAVGPEGAGTNHRNHCPNCLSSLHVDETPGDRAADCGGVMEPVAVWVRRGGEWAIIHRCKRCGTFGPGEADVSGRPAFGNAAFSAGPDGADGPAAGVYGGMKKAARVLTLSLLLRIYSSVSKG